MRTLLHGGEEVVKDAWKWTWEFLKNEDTLVLMAGRVELGRLYRSEKGVLAVTIDGNLQKEFSSVEAGKAAVEADIRSGAVVYCDPPEKPERRMIRGKKSPV